MNLLKRLHQCLGTLKSLYFNVDRDQFGHCGKNVILELPAKITKPENLFLADDVSIRGFFTFISHTGRLFIKEHVSISQRLTVVTGNHTTHPPLDRWQVDCNHTELGDRELDTVIEEDVWIGINVSLMPGVTIGRGSIIGAGSVVTRSIPPYTIAVGNPCKPLKMKFTAEEIRERERLLYPEGQRLAQETINEIAQRYGKR